MEDENPHRSDNNFTHSQKLKLKYENSRFFIVIIIVFLLLNFIFVPFEDPQQLIQDQNNNIPITNLNPSQIIDNTQKIENKNANKDKENIINENSEIKNNNENKDKKMNDKNNDGVEKMNIITKTTRNFFRNFEFFSLFGFIGLICYLMLKNYKDGDQDKLDDTDGNENEDLKNTGTKNYYELLRDSEDYYENI